MPRLIISGEPGDVHTNDTAKIQYQLLVTWSNSCGICIQHDRQVGSFWPIPFHRFCRCTQTPIVPGASAEPFVDYRAKILTVGRSQQANIMGRSNLGLVESGLVDWDDVVTPTRIRSLREVASRKKLTVNQMVGAGVTRVRAEQAFAAVHTATHDATETRRRELVKQILAKGYTRRQILDAAGRSLGSRVSIGEGPSGASAPTMATVLTPSPRLAPFVRRVAAIANAVTNAPTLKPITVDAKGRLNLTADAMRRFVADTIRHLADKFGYTYKG